MLKKFVDIIHNFFPIAAIFFAIVYLVSIDLSGIEVNVWLFILSVVLLQILFFFRVIIWFLYLKRLDNSLSFRVALVSRFRTILGKYIPGKFWIAVGSGAVQEKYSNIGFFKGTINALVFQIINIFTGVLVGLFGVSLSLSTNWKILLQILLILSLFFIFVFLSKKRTINLLEKIKYIREKFPVSTYEIPKSIDIFILFILQWLLLGMSYFVLFKSAYYDINPNIILLQPLANNIGMLSIFTPGGIGVREGIMVYYLCKSGILLKEAAILSILGRLWFIVVEFFSFGIGLFVEKRIPKELLQKINYIE